MSLTASINEVVRNPAWDIIVVLFFLVTGFIGGSMGGGRVKMLSLLFANYVSLFIAPLLFRMLDVYHITPKNSYRNIIVFFVVLGILFLLFQRKVFTASARISFTWWQAFIMSFCTVGLFVAGSLNMLSFSGILTFSPFILGMFAGRNAYLFWSLMPLVGFLVATRNR